MVKQAPPGIDVELGLDPVSVAAELERYKKDSILQAALGDVDKHIEEQVSIGIEKYKEEKYKEEKREKEKREKGKRAKYSNFQSACLFMFLFSLFIFQKKTQLNWVKTFLAVFFKRSQLS